MPSIANRRVFQAFVVALWLTGAGLFEASAEDFTTVPVIINILNNSGVTEQTARDEVKKASEILMKQLKIKLTVVDVKMLDDADGQITSFEEYKKLQEAGNKELENNAKNPNKKGIKLLFSKGTLVKVAEPVAPREVGGISVHRQPTIAVTVGQVGGHTLRTGENIAHELGHVLTLGPNHPIDGPADNPTRAGRNGHPPSNVEGLSGTGNLMASDVGTAITDPADPSRDIITAVRKGTDLGKFQKETVEKDGILDKIGKKVEKEPKEPGEKRQQQHGTKTDERGDQKSPVHLDLFWTKLSSELGQPDINVLLTLGGLFPPAGALQASYRSLFDVDASELTGLKLADFPSLGFDREARITVSGDAALGPLTVSGSVLDPVTGAVLGSIVNPTLLVGDFFPPP
jgi:hypothetical protein